LPEAIALEDTSSSRLQKQAGKEGRRFQATFGPAKTFLISNVCPFYFSGFQPSTG